MKRTVLQEELSKDLDSRDVTDLLIIMEQMNEEVLNKKKTYTPTRRIVIPDDSRENDEVTEKELIKHLVRRSSCLEDEIEKLRVENIKLRIRALMLEEEKKTELQMSYQETGRHDIL